MTPTTVRMVLVEGEKADGVTVDHDVFDIRPDGSSATSSAAQQVIAAVLGTKESAAEGGHVLKAIGVTWSDHTEAAALRDALTARGIDDVMLVSEGHAAAALAQAVGRTVGYASTALLFVDRDTATLSVVRTDDGSVVKVLSRSLHSDDAMAVLTEMAAAVDAQDAAPDGLFVVGSGVDVSSVKAHLQHLVSLPVSAPDESELALARGAALASAHAPAFEASTVGLAYSQDPDNLTTAGSAYTAFAAADTQLRPADAAAPALAGLAYADAAPEPDFVFSNADDQAPVEEGRKPFLLVGSALTSIFVLGVVALVISLAVSIRPTADQRPNPGQSAIVPSITQAPAPAPRIQEAAPAPAPPAAPPPPEVIKNPVQVAKEAPAPARAPAPRQVYVAPAAPAPAPAPAAPPPAPAPVAPPPAPIAPPPVFTPPVVLPPPVVVLPRPRLPLPIFTPPRDETPSRPWTPPWDRDDDPPQQSPNWPLPQQPQYPQYPQYPQVPPVQQAPPRQPSPLFPDSGSGSSGRGDYGDSGSDRGSSGGDRGSSGRDGGTPFWPFPSFGH